MARSLRLRPVITKLLLSHSTCASSRCGQIILLKQGAERPSPAPIHTTLSQRSTFSAARMRPCHDRQVTHRISTSESTYISAGVSVTRRGKPQRDKQEGDDHERIGAGRCA